MKNFPPKIFLRFFRWYCHPRIVDYIEGDLIEVYRSRLENMSKKKADFRFLIDVLLLFRPGIIRPREARQNINRTGMYKNYFKVTFRVFNREKLYSLINVSGLALGFTCCLLIYLFITDELSYDRFHHDNDRIYRVAAAYMRQGQWEPYASNSWRTSELFKNNYTEVEHLVRIMDDSDIIEHGDKRITERRLAYVDNNYFKLFNFPLLQGNPAEALKGPNKVVITETTAARWFGAENPIGKVFKVNDGAYEIQVTGLMKDMPSNSHFHFDFLISNETLKPIVPESMYTNVGWDSQFVYVKLVAGADPKKMEASFPEFIDKNLEFFKQTNFKLFMQPLTSIHLESNIGREFEPNGSLFRIYTFSVIAVFILVIACVNYMNLTTARSMRRAKEVGMRKVLGAKRFDLLDQFLTESFIMTAIAIVLALIVSFVVLPQFNQFAGKTFPRMIIFSPEILLTLFVALLFIGLITGLYPALVLSSFKPFSNTRGSGNTGRSGFVMRKALVVLQFAISIGLIAASAIVFQQWTFMKNKSLGINKDMLLTIPLQTMDRAQLGAFHNELSNKASIKKVGFSNMRMPGWIGNSTTYRAEGVEVDEETNKSMKIIRIDYDFISAIEANIIDGRNFSRDMPVDSASLILNESAVEQLKWTDPVGKWMQLGERRYNVVGIVKDFHFESLHREIAPIIFILNPRALNFAYVRIEKAETAETLEHIRKTYSKFVANREFTYTFVNEDIEAQYVAEEKFTQVFTLFTVLAIIIACLGTFGLISFTAERKSKEIGIRKVLGASAGNVSFMLIKEFITLLLIASIIAWPLSYYLLDGWIEGFVYRTSIGATPFVIATVLAVVIVLLTTGFRAMKAALANPVDSLRDE
jgi:putative ABC transport system permease protein